MPCAVVDRGRSRLDRRRGRPKQAIRFPLKTANRHGLVAGATGTGKTTTLRTLAEQLSAAGVSVFATDVKGVFPALRQRETRERW